MGGPGGGDSAPWVAPGAGPPSSGDTPRAASSPTPPPAPPAPPPTSSSCIVGIAIVGGIAAILLVVLAVVVATGVAEDHHHHAEPSSAAEGWHYDGPAERNVGLVTDGEQVCATDTARDELFCVDTANGTKIWDVVLPGPASQPVLVGETLVVAADGGTLTGDLFGYSLDGDPLWQTPDIQTVDVETLAGPGDSLAVVGDVVAVPLGEAGQDGAVGIDARSGQEVWRVDNTDPTATFAVVGNLVSDGHRFYSNGSIDDPVPGREIVALDHRTGRLLWRRPIPAEPRRDASVLRTAVAVDGGTAVALGIYGEEGSETVVVDAATGTARWRVLLETSWGGLAHLDGVTVVADGTALRGYDSEGTELWKTTMPGSRPAEREDVPSPELVVTGGRMYALRGHLVAVDPADGAPDIVLEHSAPLDVVAADDHLVAAGWSGWEAVPL